MFLAMFLASLIGGVHAGTEIYTHGWDTVHDVMGMHGKFGSADDLPSDASLKFVGANYPFVTTGSGCAKKSKMSLEDASLYVAAKIKAANPKTKVGMYWRTDMAKEISQCSNFSSELKTHGTDWFLRDDNNTLVQKGNDYIWDYSNKDGAAFFANAITNVVKQTLPSGAPAMDYIYLDGPGWGDIKGISTARNAKLRAAKMAWLADLQTQFDAVPGGRNIILNGVDNPDTAAQFSPTGASGVMFDHWSILQYLLRGPQFGCGDAKNLSAACGKFNTTAMDAAFDFIRSPIMSNMTVQVKGWVGPVIKQPGHYAPQIHTPTGATEQAQVAGERFNSELALFLLVAEDHMFWMYSWFWGFDSWVPDQSDSQVPHGFFPQTKCQLGAPAGPPKRVGETWTYTREYAHASVFVNLDNRTASRVEFKGNC
jgi:hypothetical protein